MFYDLEIQDPDPDREAEHKKITTNFIKKLGRSTGRRPTLMGAAGEFSGKLIDSAGREVRVSHLPDFITLVLHTGCRKEELPELEWRQVNLQERIIFLEGLHTKSGRRRSIPLNRAAYEALRPRFRFRAAHCPVSLGGILPQRWEENSRCQNRLYEACR